MSEDDAISCLILGTESRQIYVLDPEAFTILTTVSVQLSRLNWLYDVLVSDWRGFESTVVTVASVACVEARAARLVAWKAGVRLVCPAAQSDVTVAASS